MLLFSLFLPAAHAQLDGGIFDIWQDGAIAGAVCVPDHVGQSTFWEAFVLYAEFDGSAAWSVEPVEGAVCDSVPDFLAEEIIEGARVVRVHNTVSFQRP